MKLSKILSVAIIAIMLVASMSNIVFAKQIGSVNISATYGNAAQQVGGIGNSILGIVQTVGTIASVIVLVILGIKYMMGSAEEKAEYKKTLLPYVIGAVLVLAAVNIVEWVGSGFGTLFGAIK